MPASICHQQRMRGAIEAKAFYRHFLVLCSGAGLPVDGSSELVVRYTRMCFGIVRQ